jgi:RNA polymerase sigma-70 factor (ECF subfamily)
MDQPSADERRTPTDAELVAQCVAGSTEAFQTLTVRYYRPVGGFLFKRVQRPDLVEDLVQEAFLEAFRSLKAGRRPEHFSSWLFGIAQHCCGKWLRRKRPVLFDPHEPPAELPASLENALEEEEEQRRLLAALDTSLAALPDETRRLLEWKHRHGKTCEQIAAEMGRPVGTVKSLLSRTYKLLRARLSPGGGEGP